VKSGLPTISIITPTYNQGHFIEQTINSVLDQNYPNLQYLIIDGGSTDDTVNIIRKYEKYISYWVSEKDKGQSEAINKGFTRATGEVVNWLNSDDYYEPGVLSKVGEAFKDENVNVVCGRSRVFGHGDTYVSNGTDLYPENIFKTIGWARIDQPETFFRYSTLKDIGFVNEGLHFIMDKEMWIRYLLKFGLTNVVKLPGVFANYRLHGNSKTVSLQKGFEEETRNLYYTIAKRFCPETFSGFFEQNFGAQLLPLEGYDQLLNKEDAYHIVNYYLLEQALMEYAKDNYPAAKNLIAQINIDALKAPEQKELHTVLKRMKIPLIVKRLFHSIKSKGK
jgi:glycosyltransferase involved in cell wall biosynthesis